MPYSEKLFQPGHGPRPDEVARESRSGAGNDQTAVDSNAVDSNAVNADAVDSNAADAEAETALYLAPEEETELAIAEAAIPAAQTAMAFLKQQTAELHEAAEVSLAVRSRLTSRVGYSIVLAVHWHGLKPVSDAIIAHPAFDRVPDAPSRGLMQSLLEDLIALGADASAVEGCGLSFDIDPTCEASMLGALYVLEGSTLGGVHLSRMVHANLDGERQDGTAVRMPTAYFDRYGSELGPRWKRFTEYVNARLTDRDAWTKAAAAAEAVFEQLIDVAIELSPPDERLSIRSR